MNKTKQSRNFHYKAVWAKSQAGVNPRLMDAWIINANSCDSDGHPVVVRSFKAETLTEAREAMKLARGLAKYFNAPLTQKALTQMKRQSTPEQKARAAERRVTNLEVGERLDYLGCSIVREGEYGFVYMVLDQNGNRVTGLPTLQRAKNAIKKLVNQPNEN